ncbi:54S ribosomal protein L31, mitochondrial [Mycena venus]|uniref:54S ribosomal protein L31, mitochondrial n=1 Tax=Mycena venus TaxID=2733690 RepID=A0A8H7CJP7_9AGAR|nr:54S ribosomal protein L31, mitochondrial [Mycena venus]
MFGAFRASHVNQGGLLWKTPWKLASGVHCHSLDRALEIPKEHEMAAKDKYTVFTPHAVGYRKGIHKVPKWTRITQRTNPKGF